MGDDKDLKMKDVSISEIEKVIGEAVFNLVGGKGVEVNIKSFEVIPRSAVESAIAGDNKKTYSLALELFHFEGYGNGSVVGKL